MTTCATIGITTVAVVDFLSYFCAESSLTKSANN